LKRLYQAKPGTWTVMLCLLGVSMLLLFLWFFDWILEPSQDIEIRSVPCGVSCGTNLVLCNAINSFHLNWIKTGIHKEYVICSPIYDGSWDGPMDAPLACHKKTGVMDIIEKYYPTALTSPHPMVSFTFRLKKNCLPVYMLLYVCYMHMIPSFHNKWHFHFKLVFESRPSNWAPAVLTKSINCIL
jgi:hypothetical protein